MYHTLGNTSNDWNRLTYPDGFSAGLRSMINTPGPRNQIDETKIKNSHPYGNSEAMDTLNKRT